MVRKSTKSLLLSFVVAGTMTMAGAAGAQTVQACPNPDNCAQLSVGTGTVSGGNVTVPVMFKQGPSDGRAGGIDEIAAIAFTLDIGPNLRLASCTFDSEGLPESIQANLDNFRVVVENASCAGGRTHCLCPENGGSPDHFINFVIYGPNPLPTPGPNPIEIPILPAGPQQLFTVGLAVSPGASGTTPLHVYTETVDSSKPQFTAYLSVGDKLAVDQTCVPVSGQPPCSGAGAVSQVAITDGSVNFGSVCGGDCNGDGEVTVDELLKMVNISLEVFPVSQCLAGDLNSDGVITVDEIIKAVNNALNGCPSS